MTELKALVSVKALEWREEEHNWFASYPDVLGFGYEVRLTDRGAVRVREGRGGWENFPGTLDEAKAAMLASYESRILSSLSPSREAGETGEWRYDIQHGPDGEANYAWLYRGNEMVATMRTHHAREIVAALTTPPTSEAEVSTIKAEADKLTTERNLYKGKYASLLALIGKMRDRIAVITTEIEDEGDRAYFGSTNDADELKEFESDMMDWLIDAKVPHLTMTEDPYASIREQRARADKAEAEVSTLKAEVERMRKRLDAGPHGEDAIDVAESAMGFLRHRIDVLEKAMKMVVSYDDLLRRFEGPAQDTLFSGDVPVIDAAYDEMVAAAREALGSPALHEVEEGA